MELAEKGAKGGVLPAVGFLLDVAAYRGLESRCGPRLCHGTARCALLQATAHLYVRGLLYPFPLPSPGVILQDKVKTPGQFER